MYSKVLTGTCLVLAMVLVIPVSAEGQVQKKRKSNQSESTFSAEDFTALKWRNLGPFRGGRAVAAAGVPGDPLTYYFGSVGGGVWKSTDAGLNWFNVSDGFFSSGSIGAIAVAPSDPNVVYVGTGEHSIRGVMTSQGDGMYRSTDAGATWVHIGLPESKTIARIRIHPDDPDLVYVAVQGSQWSDSEHRGIYRSSDGGENWEKILYVDEHTGAADLSMDANNPRILYAGMWDHRRTPWQIRSGGEGSGLYKSTDGGNSWNPINQGLPATMGKVSVDVSPANSMRLWANIEAEGKQGGVYRSDNGGSNWTQVNADRVTVARAWYYIEIYADPQDEETVYVLNSPMLKSIDGGRTFSSVPIPHVDEHDMWINPQNPSNIILANDGGTCVTFNGGQSWSTQNNQPTAQFYRVITDDQFPYRIYGGQQDNTTVSITSRTIYGGIDTRDWEVVAGGESAFLAFNNPEAPRLTFGTSIQGMLEMHDRETNMSRSVMSHETMPLGKDPVHKEYRYNWNGPLIHNRVNPKILYQGANKLLRSDDRGMSWKEISPDLTRNDTAKQGPGGIPFTNEGAGGEVYNTISYIASSPHEKGTIWVGSDDGLVHVTRDEGGSWSEVSPPVRGESLVNAIEVSPHDPATAYLAVTRYKFDDLRPMIFKTGDYGKNWKLLVEGLPADQFVRVVREDPVVKGLLYAGTEHGLYISFNDGEHWDRFQGNLPLTPITDLCIKDNDLVASTSGRGFWVLDDLGALQQSLGDPDTSELTLFKPKTTYRFSVGGGFEKGNVGQNPLPGVTFDYYLPHGLSDSATLELEVLDASGKAVRKISNRKDREFKTWPGGPPRPEVLPSSPGLNRTSWNMTRNPLPAVEDLFQYGGLSGSYTGPGTYTLRLSLDGQTVEQKVELLADPRLDASPEEWSTQQEMLGQLDAALWELNTSINRMRKVKEQLDLKLDMLEESENGKEESEIIKVGREVRQSITAWEESLVQPRQETFQDVINFENKLASEINFLRSNMDNYDPVPTQTQLHRGRELLGLWSERKQEFDRIVREEIGTFNSQYREHSLPALLWPAE